MLHITEFEPHYDAIIVGARCAGAATAMLLAQAGPARTRSRPPVLWI